MSYVVLARKWRPQNFEQVVGQAHAVTTIKNAISSNRVAHAYLFAGPRGVGKTSLARIMAKALNCDRGPTPSPCQECTHCREITQGNSLDVLEIDGASNRGIDEIRELKENVQYLPSSSKYKIYIIDEVHMLTKEAFNALLKTLEEPPEHVIFIFATTEVHKVPVTILSRCQKFDFRRVPISEIRSHLQHIAQQENIAAEPEAIEAIAREADGSVRDALSLMDQILSYSPERITRETVSEILGFVDQSIILELLERVITGDLQAIIETVDRLHVGGYDLKQFYKNLMAEVRNLLFIRINSKDYTQRGEEGEEHKQRERVLSLASKHWLLTAINQLLALDAELRYATYPKYVLELGLLKLAHLNEFLSLDRLLSATGTDAAPMIPAPVSGENQEQPGSVNQVKRNLTQEEQPAHIPSAGAESCGPFLEFLQKEAVVMSSIIQRGELTLENDRTLMVLFPSNAPEAELLDIHQLKGLAERYFEKPITVQVKKNENDEIRKDSGHDKERIENSGGMGRKALEHSLVKMVTDILGAQLADVRPRMPDRIKKEASDG